MTTKGYLPLDSDRQKKKETRDDDSNGDQVSRKREEG